MSHPRRSHHRWTESEIIEVLSVLGVQLKESYKGSLKKKHLVLFSSGLEKSVVLESVINGSSTGIQKPQPSQHTDQSINLALAEFGAQLNENYKGSICKKHEVLFDNGVTKTVTLKSVLSGDATGRVNKYTGLKRRHTEETLGEILASLDSPVYLLEKFKGSVALKHLVEYSCGHTNDVRLDGILYSGKGCPHCIDYGFNTIDPAYLYLLEVSHEGQILYKVGITNNTVQRRYSREGATYTLISLYKHSHGMRVRNAEQAILGEFEYLSYQGSSPFRNTGTKEIFTRNILTLQKFQEIIDKYKLEKVEVLTSV